jgi:N6-adenosine-specific RNA methylase IME4
MTFIAQPYACILIDPPWPEQGGGKIVRGAQRHYGLLHVKDIAPTILAASVYRPAENAHLWLWVTRTYLPHGLQLIQDLDFRYVTNAVWVKDRAGIGYYLAGQHENLLLGIRGKCPPLRRMVPSVIQAKRRAHSQKPEEAYDLIEAISPGSRLEMFARAKREGWTSWGDEVS